MKGNHHLIDRQVFGRKLIQIALCEVVGNFYTLQAPLLRAPGSRQSAAGDVPTQIASPRSTAASRIFRDMLYYDWISKFSE